MNTLLLTTSFIAGVLTILAPCVLPLLPVIVGSSAGSQNKYKPLIVTASLASSIVIFTLLLKATTALINIPQSFWTSLSGGIVLLFGMFLLLPELWDKISLALNFSTASQQKLAEAGTGESVYSSILIGAALGPVFSSCSPTYFLILATVLPVNFATGVIYLMVYALGLTLSLGLIAYFGQAIISKLGWAANPRGWFKRAMGILLILVGLAVITGIEKKIESAILNAGYGVTGIEERLLETMEEKTTNQKSMDTSSLPILYEAKELNGLTNWINSEPINSMEELKGKVVLIDFWTYSCINCIRTIPHIQAWHEKYADEGLVIIGVHAPEFQFEQIPENVQKAVNNFGITYKVVQDNDFTLWKAYKNKYWPAEYLIDREGNVRYTHFGEGKYEETEKAITDLLGAEIIETEVAATSVDFKKIGTKETYIGTARRSNYSTDPQLDSNEWTLQGSWAEDNEKAVSKAPNSSIKMKFTANKANLVIGGTGTATVLIDGQLANETNSGKDVKNGELQINGERLYELTDFKNEYSEHEIEVQFKEHSISVFAWTFG